MICRDIFFSLEQSDIGHNINTINEGDANGYLKAIKRHGKIEMKLRCIGFGWESLHENEGQMSQAVSAIINEKRLKKTRL